MLGIDLITIAIIAANVILSLKGFDDFYFKQKYLFNIAAIHRGEYVRFLSSGFLHANTTHLFFNMLTLYFFAGPVIAYLGVLPFVIIYLGSLLGGNLLSYVFHKNEYHYSALGASGAVTGVLFSFILLDPQADLFLLFLPIAIPAWIFGLLYLGFSIYGMKKQLGNIGHDAHFGGAVVGYALTILFVPSLLQTSLQTILLLGVPIAALFVLMQQKLL